MGLDSVEFIIAVEASFDVDIADADAEKITTPRSLVEYLAARLPLTTASGGACTTQAAFYRIRRAAQIRFGHERKALKPDTAVDDVLPIDRKEGWRAWQKEVGAEVWPSYAGPLGCRFLASPRTVGELARVVANQNAAFVRNGRTWTRLELENVVRWLIHHELGVDMSKYTLDSHFVHDMGAL